MYKKGNFFIRRTFLGMLINYSQLNSWMDYLVLLVDGTLYSWMTLEPIKMCKIEAKA